MNLFIVVDMQNDFIDGALGSEEAVKIVPLLAEKIKSFEGIVLFTRDTHGEDYLQTQEGKYLPVKHCIKETNGWKIHPLLDQLRTTTPIDKPSFGSIELLDRVKDLSLKEEICSITLAGVCTDICVISNAMVLKTFFPEVPIKVNTACCAGVTKESHQRALEAMKMCHIVME